MFVKRNFIRNTEKLKNLQVGDLFESESELFILTMIEPEYYCKTIKCRAIRMKDQQEMLFNGEIADVIRVNKDDVKIEYSMPMGIIYERK